MRKLCEVLMVTAMVAFSVMGLSACGEDGALLPPVYLLGMDDGPTPEQMAGFFADACDGEDCDGEIEDGSSATARGADPDDDLLALVEGFYSAINSEPALAMSMAFSEEFLDLIPEEPEEGEIYALGPQSGLLDLDDTCGEGSGQNVVTLRQVAEVVDVKGVQPQPTSLYVRSTFFLDNCEIEGEIDGDPGVDFVRISGTFDVLAQVILEEVHVTLTANLLVNPALAQTAQTAGASDVIWGENVVVTAGANQIAESTLGLPESSGGLCYGGILPTEAGCDGIFVSAGDLFENLPLF